MFNSTVFSLGVLPDCDQVHISVGGLVALNGHAGPHISIEVEGFPQQQVHGGMASSYWCLQRAFRLLKNSKIFHVKPKEYI